MRRGPREPAERPEAGTPGPGVPWGALIASLVLVLGAAIGAGWVLETRERLRAERTAAEITLTVERRMRTYVALLRGTAALFAYDESIDRRGFRRFVARLRLEQYPGIQGLGFTQRLRPGEAERVVAEARKSGEPDFRLWPEHAEERHAIVFLEPESEANRSALGYDMHHEPVRRLAMDRARDTGDPAATGIVRLVQESALESPQPGFLIYTPVYEGGPIRGSLEERREALRGFSYAAFRAGDLFDELFDELEPGLGVSIHDATLPGVPTLLFERAGSREATEHSRSFDEAGRLWTITVRVPSGQVSDTRLVVGSILAVGALFTLILLNLERSHRRSETRRAVESALVAETRQTQLRETFMGVLGHDLRNPLGAAKMSAEMLLADPALSEKSRRGAERIRRSLDRALRLIHQLLDLTRVRLGSGLKVEPKPLSLPALLGEVVEEARLAHGEGKKTVEVDPEPGLSVKADPDRVAQILSNLTSNALTHGQPPIRVRCRKSGPFAEIEVSNAGEPIPPETLATLFDPFTRAEGASAGGLGLGLYISQQLALAQGGSLEVESDAESTRFLLKLPLA